VDEFVMMLALLFGAIVLLSPAFSQVAYLFC